MDSVAEIVVHLGEVVKVDVERAFCLILVLPPGLLTPRDEVEGPCVHQPTAIPFGQHSGRHPQLVPL